MSGIERSSVLSVSLKVGLITSSAKFVLVLCVEGGEVEVIFMLS